MPDKSGGGAVILTRSQKSFQTPPLSLSPRFTQTFPLLPPLNIAKINERKDLTNRARFDKIYV